MQLIATGSAATSFFKVYFTHLAVQGQSGDMKIHHGTIIKHCSIPKPIAQLNEIITYIYILNTFIRTSQAQCINKLTNYILTRTKTLPDDDT
jgi:hypothetical protein